MDCRYMLEVVREVPAGSELLVYYGPRDHHSVLYIPAWPEREYYNSGVTKHVRRRKAVQAARARKSRGEIGRSSGPAPKRKKKACPSAVASLLEGVDSNGACSSSTANALREAGYRVDRGVQKLLKA